VRPDLPSARRRTSPDEERTAAALATWRQLFDTARYYEAHEVVEDRWHVEVEPARAFLKGLIHLSVSLTHFQRGNPHGARVKFHSACRYLEPYLPEYEGVPLAELLRSARRQLAMVLDPPSDQ
jgi:predicted metal-dependent hydrolase